jgi:hypothetical protein
MHACKNYQPRPITRRQMLQQSAIGFGAIALAALSNEQSQAASVQSQIANLKSQIPPLPHFPPKVRNVIFCYMDGGVSAVDSFNPKPLLTKEHGQPFKMKMEPTQFNNNGNTLGSPWKFKNYGQSGLPISDLFPHIGSCADDLAIIHSMTSNFSEHTGANYFLHTGSGMQGRPSMGAWVGYGLGTENKNLPGFVVLNGGLIPPGGLDNFNSGFLPASYQGSIFRPAKEPVANITPLESKPSLQRSKLDLISNLDHRLIDRIGKVDAVESAIANYELAYAMQSAVPELMDLTGETAATKSLYGLDAAYDKTRIYAQQCLLARRMIERGVRFVELTCPSIPGNDRWDAHGGLRKNHSENALAVDQPIAALLKDLKSRGLLDETLVVFSGEFGRTPFAQGSDGRDHNPYGFSLWLAGGGVKGGISFGQTDEYGYKAIENKLQIHDLHATMLHLLGLNHKKTTFRWGGRDMRLTDVHGELIDGILT